MKKVKKTLAGYKEVDSSYGSNADYTHVIYEAWEYDRMIEGHTSLERQFSTLKVNKEFEIADLKTVYGREKYAIEQAYKNEIDRLKEELDESKRQCLDLANSNKNLTRIARERGNAEREMTPKKKLLGYVLLSMEQTTFHFRPEQKNNRTKTVPLLCWKIRLQTPFEVQVEAPTIETLVSNDLYTKLGAILDIDRAFKGDTFLTMPMDKLMALWDEYKLVFKTSYKLNTIGGFWEVEYLVNKPILVLPEILPQKKK